MSSVNLYDVNIEKPRYDQEIYWGRAKHFFAITNPINVFATQKSLDNAKSIVSAHRQRKALPQGLDLEGLWAAKTLYDSAFHPDTGDQMFVIGRMSAQVPCNMLITGGMMSFYRSTPAVIFWQWFNQSFNALVNYTNRGGDSTLSTTQLMTAYALATGGAVSTALGLNALTKNMSPLVGRMVPFFAVAAANCINIPCMRFQEITDGTPVTDASTGKKYGDSKIAAVTGIAMVVLSRSGMATPGMVATPFVMNALEKRDMFRGRAWLAPLSQVLLLGAVLTLSTPLCCAVFKQRAAIPVERVETDIRDKVYRDYGSPEKSPPYLFYNKGL